jgi:hypothetical protein
VNPNAFTPAARDQIGYLRMLGLADSDNHIVDAEGTQ